MRDVTKSFASSYSTDRGKVHDTTSAFSTILSSYSAPVTQYTCAPCASHAGSNVGSAVLVAEITMSASRTASSAEETGVISTANCCFICSVKLDRFRELGLKTLTVLISRTKQCPMSTERASQPDPMRPIERASVRAKYLALWAATPPTRIT